jgi:hypothetical protein
MCKIVLQSCRKELGLGMKVEGVEEVEEVEGVEELS